MMVAVLPRRWDTAISDRKVTERATTWGTARIGAVLALVIALTAACGQARAAAPPIPEFTSGVRAEPTVLPSTTVPSEADLILPTDVEADGSDSAGVDDAGAAFDVD